jgi:hypothetical protein
MEKPKSLCLTYVRDGNKETFLVSFQAKKVTFLLEMIINSDFTAPSWFVTGHALRAFSWRGTNCTRRNNNQHPGLARL